MNKKIMPPTYFLILLVSNILLGVFFPYFKFLSYPYTLLGIIPILFGIVLNLWADNLFKKYNTTVKPHLKPTTLICSGPFKISRHPMYLGMIGILLGVSIIFGKVLCFIFPLVFILLMEIIFIPIEEINMEKSFGEKYTKYKEKVRKWI